MKQSSYELIRPQLQMGDAFFCSGNSTISKAIEFVTHSPWSHVACVYRAGDSDDLVQWIESTQMRGYTGVSITRASERIAEYAGEGGRVVWAPIRADLRARSDWPKWQAWMLSMDHKPYDYRQMLRMIFEPFAHVPIVGEVLTNHEQMNSEYCSELKTLGEKLIGIVGLSVNAAGTSPADAYRFAIYGEPVQVAGPALTQDYGFNLRPV